MIEEFEFNQQFQHLSVSQKNNDFGQIGNVYIDKGILFGETPTQSNKQTQNGEGNSPDVSGSSSNTYINIRLEPIQFGNDPKQIKQGDLLVWNQGQVTERVFVIEMTHKDTDFEIGQLRYWRAKCTIQSTKYQINP
jgi:hypothetical protein